MYLRSAPAVRTGLLIMAVVLGLGTAACAQSSGSGNSAGSSLTSSTPPTTPAPTASPAAPASTSTGGAAGSQGGATNGSTVSANAALASVAFVTAAMAGENPSSFLASAPHDDPRQGAPYNPTQLTTRLGELAALVAVATTARPSADAYPAGGTGLAPACDGSVGLRCMVDLLDANGQPVASVVVHWLADGVTDFVVMSRDGTGAVHGIGRASCSPGSSLVFGGQAPDRFDIAVCIDGRGQAEYNGVDRGPGLGTIRLPACLAGPNRWEATNNGFRYVVDGNTAVDGDGVAWRSTLQVLNPAGKVAIDTPFTAVHLELTRASNPC